MNIDDAALAKEALARALTVLRNQEQLLLFNFERNTGLKVGTIHQHEVRAFRQPTRVLVVDVEAKLP